MRDGQRREGEAPPLPEPLPLPVTDSHCHLDLMGIPVEQALSEARSVGVTRLMTIGVDLETSRWSADTAQQYDGVGAGVAIHPNEAARGVSPETLGALAELAARPEVRAIGETGLDFFRTEDADGHARQEESFRAHIALAKQHDKALVIHDRDAHEAVLRVLAEEGAPRRTVFHCFSGDEAMARECARAGYVLSFAGNVTFKPAQHLRDALRVTPLDLLLVETDAPFLTPVPHRGRPNSPAQVPVTVRAMAEVLQVDLEALCLALHDNAERVFGPV